MHEEIIKKQIESNIACTDFRHVSLISRTLLSLYNVVNSFLCIFSCCFPVSSVILSCSLHV